MKRALVWTLGSVVVTTTLALGALHSDAGRAVLGGVTRMAHGGCPFGYDKPMSGAARERASANFAASHRGPQRALAQPALGFDLGHTTRAQVLSAMQAQGVQCVPAKGLSDLTCNGVPTSALPSAPAAPPRNLWLTFGAKEQLLAVISISRSADAEPVSSAYLATCATLDRDAGRAASTSGNPEPEQLAAGLLRQASTEFRFTNYYAGARVTNMGRGFALSEEYRALPD